MSRLSDNLKAYRTDKLYAKFKPIEFLTLDDKIRPSCTPDYRDEYEIKCTLGSVVKFNSTDSSQTKDYIIRDCKRAILEEIFGEFKEDLYKAIRATHDNDSEKAYKHLDRIYQNMYDY